MLGGVILAVLCVYLVGALDNNDNTVLVLGGQGLAGSATLKSLLENGYQVSVLNNGENYFDYHALYSGDVESVACLRPAGLQGCFELKQFLQAHPKVHAIVDFTSSNPGLMEEAIQVLGALDPDVWVFVSAAAVYDVSVEAEQPLAEESAIRPKDPEQRAIYNEHNEFGHKMLGSEEVLRSSGLPYVVLRCGDLVGPRDTTHRWWQYQIWSEHFDVINTGFPVPNDYAELPFSLTFGGDVGQAVTSVLTKRITNEIYNVALDKAFTLPHLLLELCSYFGNTESCWADYTDASETYHLFPSNHMGVLNTDKAKKDLDFVPAEWDDVMRSTVEFYEGARRNFAKERDIVLTKLNKNVVPYLRLEKLNEAVLHFRDTPSNDLKVEL